MKCFAKGFAACLLTCLVVALLVPTVRRLGPYTSKKLLIQVRVFDTDDNKPVKGAEVTFFQASSHTFNTDADQQIAWIQNAEKSGETFPSAVTLSDGSAEVEGTFHALASRNPAWIIEHDRNYRLGGGWLKVSAPGRPVTYVPLNGQNFGGERDYDNDLPLEVFVVLNKAPAP